MYFIVLFFICLINILIRFKSIKIHFPSVLFNSPFASSLPYLALNFRNLKDLFVLLFQSSTFTTH